MKYQKPVHISRKSNEVYYGYFDTQKSMTVYRFKNMTLYMNNDIGIDILNIIDRNVKINRGKSIRDFCAHLAYHVVKDTSQAGHDYGQFFIYERFFSNLKIISNTKFKAYLSPKGSSDIIEFDIDMTQLLSFYSGFDIEFDNNGICTIKLLNREASNGDMYDTFKLDLDISKHKKIILSADGIEPDIVAAECRQLYARFLLKHI